MVSAVEDAERRRQSAADTFMRHIAARPIAKIRIGKVIIRTERDIDPCSRLIVENGRIILGMWRLSAHQFSGQTIYERLP
jgi:hypothetical protein